MEFTPAVQKPRSLRILLVEDHKATGGTMAKLLRQRAHETVWASTASEALVIARNHRFDLLISDLGLPDLHGWDLLKELKRMVPGMRAIALSGFGRQGDLDRSAEAGFDLHLIKPARMADIDAAIAAIFPDARTGNKELGSDPKQLI